MKEIVFKKLLYINIIYKFYIAIINCFNIMLQPVVYKSINIYFS